MSNCVVLNIRHEQKASYMKRTVNVIIMIQLHEIYRKNFDVSSERPSSSSSKLVAWVGERHMCFLLLNIKAIT
jgi:hypothetical protein